MPVKINPTYVSETLDMMIVGGTLTLTGAYPVGGDPMDWTTIIGYQSPNGRIFTPSALPVACDISSTGGDTLGYAVGTTLANGKLIANTSSATVVSGNYGAELTADLNIEFQAWFPKQL